MQFCSNLCCNFKSVLLKSVLQFLFRGSAPISLVFFLLYRLTSEGNGKCVFPQFSCWSNIKVVTMAGRMERVNKELGGGRKDRRDERYNQRVFNCNCSEEPKLELSLKPSAGRSFSNKPIKTETRELWYRRER